MRKRYLFLIIVVLPLVIWQSLNQNNFCYADMSFNKPYEVLDRFLFGEGYRDMSLEEKIEKAASDPTRGALEYPNCCIASIDRNKTLGWLERAYGMGSYSLSILRPNIKKGSGAYHSIIYVDQCANYSGDDFGERLSEESYLRTLNTYGRVTKRRRAGEE